MTAHAPTRPPPGFGDPTCAHAARVEGVCVICGHCAHDVILNAACFICGATDLPPINHKQSPPPLVTIRKR